MMMARIIMFSVCLQFGLHKYVIKEVWQLFELSELVESLTLQRLITQQI